jgi:hypothetical protein
MSVLGVPVARVVRALAAFRATHGGGTAMNDDRARNIWLPEFDVETEAVIGQEWPRVIVTKWETNQIGERRYVETRIYQAPDWPERPPTVMPL